MRPKVLINPDMIDMSILRRSVDTATHPLETKSNRGAMGARMNSPEFPKSHSGPNGRQERTSSTPASGSIHLDTYSPSDSDNVGNESVTNRYGYLSACMITSNASSPPVSQLIQARRRITPTTPNAQAQDVVQYRNPHVLRLLHQSTVIRKSATPHSPEENISSSTPRMNEGFE